MKDIILNQLKRGQENAISSRQLQSICGCNERKLRKIIRTLRLSGVVILSTVQRKGGYYLPSNTAEAQRYLQQEEHRAKAIFAGIKAARHEAYLNDKQIAFNDSEIRKNG